MNFGQIVIVVALFFWIGFIVLLVVSTHDKPLRPPSKDVKRNSTQAVP
jgi:hypothetical protein